jgi:uncharacterized protein
MQQIITDNYHAITSLCRHHYVQRLAVFGSVCTDRFTDESDIDLLVSFEAMDYGDYADNYFELADKFEELFHRRVDLVTEESLSNPYFIQSVNHTKKVLFNSISDVTVVIE